MLKVSIFKPRKTFKSAKWGVVKAVEDLSLTGAESIGVELVKVDGIYYTVRNIHEGVSGDNLDHCTLIDTDNATERFTPAQFAHLI